MGWVPYLLFVVVGTLSGEILAGGVGGLVAEVVDVSFLGRPRRLEVDTGGVLFVGSGNDG
jgi:hypothetical protein